MTKRFTTGKSGLRALIATALLLALIGGVTGCGAEAQKPVAGPTGNSAPPGGTSQDDYAKKMKEMQKGPAGAGGGVTK